MVLTFRYCSKCGAANPQSAGFCFACGVSMKTTVPLSAESSPGRLVPRSLFKERFRILSEVGSGGFGAVYKAEDLQEDNRLVAIKEIRLAGLNAAQMIDATDAFNREVDLLSGLKHPSIPRIYVHYAEAKNWYLVMDFIEGETLEAYRTGAKQGKLTVEQVMVTGLQLCTILEYLHTRQPSIIYRDLKPSNIILAAEGKLYLIDFGVARRFRPNKKRDTVAFGSPGYAAPEQYGRAQTTPRSDIYALGATFHYLLTGSDPEQNPFHFDALRLHVPSAPTELETLLASMLEMDASKRPESVVIVQRELRRIIDKYAIKLPAALFPGAIDPAVLARRRAISFSTRGVTVYIHREHQDTVRAIAWSPDGKRIASAGEDRKVQVWSMLEAGKVFNYRNHSDTVYAVAWSPRGEYIASASGDHTVQVWDAGLQPRWFSALAFRTGFNYNSYEEHESAVMAVAWSPDGEYIASAGSDNTVKMWEVRTRKTIFTYQGHSDVVHAVAWSPNGRYIASASLDHSLHIWNVQTGEKKFINHHSTSIVYALAWSPDGKHLAVGGSSYTILVLNVGTGRKVSTDGGHEQGVRALTWSPDGKWIASGGKDRVVRIWEAMTGQEVYVYREYGGDIWAVAWSPDGQYIASTGGNDSIYVWRAT